LAKDPYGPFALILTPTRELAFQIAEQFRAIGSGINVREIVVVGGMDMMAQSMAIETFPHILVGTPGRLVDHIQSGTKTKLNRIQFLVLDEADRLLTPTFSKDLETIFELLPQKRQTLLFSATMTKNIEMIMEKDGASKENSKQVKQFVYRGSDKYESVDKLEQMFLFVPKPVKEAYLVYLLRERFSSTSTIIFFSRCRYVAFCVGFTSMKLVRLKFMDFFLICTVYL
jgi:ATP-dependent RNA helicase DDX49/DBP8